MHFGKPFKIVASFKNRPHILSPLIDSVPGSTRTGNVPITEVSRQRNRRQLPDIYNHVVDFARITGVGIMTIPSIVQIAHPAAHPSAFVQSPKSEPGICPVIFASVSDDCVALVFAQFSLFPPTHIMPLSVLSVSDATITEPAFLPIRHIVSSNTARRSGTGTRLGRSRRIERDDRYGSTDRTEKKEGRSPPEPQRFDIAAEFFQQSGKPSRKPFLQSRKNQIVVGCVWPYCRTPCGVEITFFSFSDSFACQVDRVRDVMHRTIGRTQMPLDIRGKLWERFCDFLMDASTSNPVFSSGLCDVPSDRERIVTVSAFVIVSH